MKGSFYEEKASYLDTVDDISRPQELLYWYIKNKPEYFGRTEREANAKFKGILSRLEDREKALRLKNKISNTIAKLASYKIRFLPFNFVRWVLVDYLRGKRKRSFGIYQFVALPGQGKTMSMVAHIERFIQDMEEQKKPYVIATNFTYSHANYYIEHWLDMVNIAKDCYKRKIACLIAFDEIHVTFDSSDWKDFPPEMLALLSFNRKYGLQFCCTSQIYERIPKKIRDIANYTVICKNICNADRWFRCYYFDKCDYEVEFDGKRKKCKFIKEFIADDDFYALYDTLEQVDNMIKSAKEEKSKREQAFNLLFGSPGDEQEAKPAEPRTTGQAERGGRGRRSSKENG